MGWGIVRGIEEGWVHGVCIWGVHIWWEGECRERESLVLWEHMRAEEWFSSTLLGY